MAVATYFIDGTYGNDSTGNGSAATPWATIEKYALGGTLAGDSNPQHTIVLSGHIRPSTSATYSGNYTVSSRILDLTGKSSGSFVRFRARTYADGLMGTNPVEPPVISPWIAMTGSLTAANATYLGLVISSAQTAPTSVNTPRIAAVAFRPLDPHSVSSHGLPAFRFRPARAGNYPAPGGSDSVTIGNAATSTSNDDGVTGLSVGTFYVTSDNKVVINLGTTANATAVMNSLNTTIGNWFIMWEDSQNATGLGVQCASNGTVTASGNMPDTDTPFAQGITVMDYRTSRGTGHSIVHFDAARTRITNNRVVNAGAHAIAVSNSANSHITSALTIEDVEIAGLSGGNAQGNSAILVGGGGTNQVVSGVRIRRCSIRLHAPLGPAAQTATAAPLLRSGVGPFRFLASGTGGLVSDVQVEDADVTWLAGLTSDLSSPSVSGYGSSGRTSETPILCGGGQCPLPANKLDPASYPIRFIRCTFMGGITHRMDSSDTRSVFNDVTHSASFTACTIDASNYGACLQSGGGTGSGIGGAISVSNGGSAQASSIPNTFLFVNSKVIARASGIGIATSTGRMLFHALFATYTTTFFTTEMYFRNCDLGLINASNSAGASHRFARWDNNNSNGYANGLYLDIEACDCFFAGPTPIPNSGSSLDRFFLNNDNFSSNPCVRLYNNTYWNMPSAAQMSSRTAINTFRTNGDYGNFRSANGDPLAKMEFGPLPLHVSRTLPFSTPTSTSPDNGSYPSPYPQPAIRSIRPGTRMPL